MLRALNEGILRGIARVTPEGNLRGFLKDISCVIHRGIPSGTPSEIPVEILGIPRRILRPNRREFF